MKYIKLVLSLSFLLLAGKLVKAQKIIDNSLFFHITYNAMQSPPNDKSAYIDTLNIYYSNHDTIVFSVGNNSFLKSGEKVSLIENYDTILLYDYNLVAGDTFVLNYYNDFVLAVDSVLVVEYADGNMYKEWCLHYVQEPSLRVIWVENLGVKYFGWDWSKFNITNGQDSLKAICNNGDLIFWRVGYSDFLPNQDPTPTCNFDLLISLLSVTKAKELTDNTVFFTITVYDGTYPNILTGESDTLKITYNNLDTVAFTVGKENLISYLKVGKKISCIILHSQENQDTILLYDYNLVAGDTFSNLYLVDSVVFAKYLDGEIYKEWHFHRIDYPADKTVWIENMGAKNRMWGWDYLSHIPEYISFLKAICYENELIYWEAGHNDFFPNPDLNASCNFDLLRNLLSVPELMAEQITIYPNPAQSELFLEESLKGEEYKILNSIGEKVSKGVYDGNAISTYNLASGIYLIQIQTREQVFQARFMKE